MTFSLRIRVGLLLSVALSAVLGCVRQVLPDPIHPHDTFTLESRALAETRRINVYMPPGYTADATARFPVLYMPDGGLHEDFPHITHTVDTLIGAGEMRPFIVVGIENTERRRDMTGPTEVAEDRKVAPRVGGSAAFRAFIRDELMPEIRARYRCTEETAIIGESLAGLFILETFFVEPGMFDTSIAISPSLWWNDHALERGAQAWLGEHPELRHTLYLTAADETDIFPYTDALARTLATSAPTGLTWHYEPRRDEHHHTIYRATAPRAMRKVLGPASAREP